MFYVTSLLFVFKFVNIFTENMSLLIKTCMHKFIAPQIKIRHYARWAPRKPIDHSQEEIEEFETPKKSKDNSKEELKIKWRQEVAAQTTPIDIEEVDRHELRNFKRKPKIAKVKPTDMLETVIDNEGNTIYTKMNNNDSRVGTLLTTLKSKKEKLKKDLILLEGKRLIQEALITGCKLKYLIFTRKDEIEHLKPHLPKIGAQIFKMPYKEMQMWSDLTTSPGLMGVFKTPDVSKYESKDPLPITIICDNIREPGNLGAVLRAAAAMGCQRLLLTKGCVNLWDTKVTRSAAGSHFRLQIHNKQEFSEIKSILPTNSQLYIADNNLVSGDSNNIINLIQNVPILPYYSIRFPKNQEIVLIIGGETEGISEDSYKLAQELNGVRLNIPLSNGVESLNTGMAFGIISFEIKRQLSSQEITATEKNEMDVSLSLRYL